METFTLTFKKVLYQKALNELTILAARPQATNTFLRLNSKHWARCVRAPETTSGEVEKRLNAVFERARTQLAARNHANIVDRILYAVFASKNIIYSFCRCVPILTHVSVDENIFHAVGSAAN